MCTPASPLATAPSPGLAALWAQVCLPFCHFDLFLQQTSEMLRHNHSTTGRSPATQEALSLSMSERPGVMWHSEMHGRHAGVSAFQAPGKRHKAHLQDSGAKGGPSPALQLLETPRPAGLPHLKVPTPGVGGAQATMESSNAAHFSVCLLAHPQCGKCLFLYCTVSIDDADCPSAETLQHSCRLPWRRRRTRCKGRRMQCRRW